MATGNSGFEFDIEDTLSKLSIQEKIALLSGKDLWHTAPVHRLGIPSIRVSDGPNGVRGTRFFNGVPAACLPCGTALAATWNIDLVRRAGTLQGEEAIAKGISVILGPTTNMQRSPLGGRGFESYSEDPFLAGAMSAANIRGIQSTGVASTLKHFVCNDQEDERMAVDSIITERALREIYLMPFMIAQRDGKPHCYMTSYNRVNGIHVSEDPRFLTTILREEWNFDGLIMSDWFGTYSTSEAILAGLDLEMPGESYIRGKLVEQALGCGKLQTRDVDDRVRQVLELIQKAQALGLPENAPERTLDTPQTADSLRALSAESIVLLKNTNNTLPFKKTKTTAVIGSNARYAAYCGGGSASLRPYHTVSPLDGIKSHAPHVEYKLGAPNWKKLPLLSDISHTDEGQKGLVMRVFLEPPNIESRHSVDEIRVDTSDIVLIDYEHPAIHSNLFWAELTGQLVPDDTGEYTFSLSVAGTAKLFIDGNLVIDNETKQQPGDSFVGQGTVEEYGTIKLEKGKAYSILKQGVTPFGAGGVRIGAIRKFDPALELEEAVQLAKRVDQVVLCVGLNKEWESEGSDRTDFGLPPGSDELIRAVAAANPNTAIILQSGTPVALPWVDEVPALLQAWYGGNEAGDAIADVIFGDTNPSGKLPLSFPYRIEDTPAFLNFKSERQRTLYGEDIYIGYRFYEKVRRDVAFPFGHGLSYTSFEIQNLQVVERTSGDGEDEIVATVTVTNTGGVEGAYVVQAYVHQHNPSINRPLKELKGFEKVFLQPGEKKNVDVVLSKRYAASFWDETRSAWIMEKDAFSVLVGDSSANTPLEARFEVQQTVWWNGL
ncbi:glycoside hydrolase family 3 protein [Hypoxylon sp. CI-4A]|nr:glycoside hydrolase family 3 protein [Hypoxylon sp. CI-4A]